MYRESSRCELIICCWKLRLPNFIFTPHVAWVSKQAMQTLADQLIDDIEEFVTGRPCKTVASLLIDTG
jgi:lactate dehydrogenase-like 2-hydroxyacid dehydrogenase